MAVCLGRRPFFFLLFVLNLHCEVGLVKLAIAQFDGGFGDIQGVCARIEEQLFIASKQDVDILCVPASFFCLPSLACVGTYGNFAHELISRLLVVSRTAQEYGIVCFIPTVASIDGTPYLEILELVDGRVVPLRLRLAADDGDIEQAIRSIPVVELDDIRMLLTFDLDACDDAALSSSDLVIFFQLRSLDFKDPSTQGAFSLREDDSAQLLCRSHGIQLAYVAPIGGFDSNVFIGGSFFLDESGQTVQIAPCFEESLMIHLVEPGMSAPVSYVSDFPDFNRERLLWLALQSHLRDSVHAFGLSKACILLSWDLPSLALFALAVDALGPRNVVALLVDSDASTTPSSQERAIVRANRLRSLAQTLNVPLVERSIGFDATLGSDRQDAGQEDRFMDGLRGICLAETARETSSLALSPFTKSDYALACGCAPSISQVGLAPFGDVYLTELEFMARERNRLSPIIPAELVRRSEIERLMGRLLRSAAHATYPDESYSGKVASFLARLSPENVDDIFESHVDRNCSLEDIDASGKDREAVSLLLLLVRKGESVRRMLPPVAEVSHRSFSERGWPVQLAWSDLGRDGSDEPRSFEKIATEERDRSSEEGADRLDRLRSEIISMIGGLLGISPEQLKSMRIRSSDGGSSDGHDDDGASDGFGGQGGPTSDEEGGSRDPYDLFSQN